MQQCLRLGTFLCKKRGQSNKVTENKLNPLFAYLVWRILVWRIEEKNVQQ